MTGRDGSTQFKLDEAKFFLEQLQPNFGRERKFDYYLSAFISAARSVTWIMRAEFGSLDGWEEWFDQLTASNEEYELLRGTNAVRIRSQKQAALRTMGVPEITRAKITKEQSQRIKEALASATDGEVKGTLRGSNGHYFIEFEIDGEALRIAVESVAKHRGLREFPARDILSVCNAYYRYLESIVQQCRDRFDA